MFYLGVNTLLFTAFSFLVSYQFIFGLFLLVNLFVGLWASKGVKSLRDYSVGNKDFSTGTLTATIVATWIGGGTMMYGLAHIYSRGLVFIISLLGTSLGLFLTGLVTVRMGEFWHKLSIAEAMGGLYGTTVRIITAISGILWGIGALAIQFKVISKILTLLFDVEGTWVTIVASLIIIIYSAFGGIRAVTTTDIFQFFAFGIFIPLLGLIIWNNLKEPSQVVSTVTNNPIFSFHNLLGWDKKTANLLTFLMYGVTPTMVPAVFQRIVMANSITQSRKSYTYAAGSSVLMFLFLAWIGILLLASNPNLEPSKLVPFILDTYSFPWLKGLIAVGITAMAMSTADSDLNASVVLFVNDIIKPLGKTGKNLMPLTKILALVFGAFALVVALNMEDLLGILLLSGSFYMPIVTVPFLLAILGFRSSTRSVLIGMAAGLITVLFWEIALRDIGIDSLGIGMLVNLIFYMGSHYVLREEGGWVGIKNKAPLIAARQGRRDAWRKFLYILQHPQIYAYLRKNIPTYEVIYTLFGIYIMGATYASFYTIPNAEATYTILYKCITTSVLFAMALFITYPAWPPTFKSERFITFVWPLGIVYVLFVVGTMLVMMSGFHEVQVMIFLLNLVMAALLLSWPLMVFLATLGVLVGCLVFNSYYGPIHLTGVMDSGQFKLIYGILLFSSFLMALFRFKQKQVDLEEKNKYLAASYEKNGQELSEVLRYREEVLRDLKEDEIQLVDQTAAAYLKQVIYRTVDYLRLDVTKIELEQLLTEVKQFLKLKDFTTTPQIVIEKHTQESTIQADAEKLKQLLVNSISYIHQHNEANKPIIITLDKAMLGHRIDQMEDYTRKLNALKITISTDGAISPTQDIYMLDQINLISKVNEHKDRRQLIENARIIDAHYGYAEFDFYTHMYVIPINVREVRGKVMELLREPTAADPEEINHPMAIQLEQALLNRLKSIKNVNIKVIEKALDTIKTYHAGVKRKSGEPFFTHPINVALILLGYCGDQDALVAGLLHDSLEDTSLSLPQVQARFGKTVAMIVEKLTNLEDRLRRFSLDNHEYIARLTQSEDKRIAYVKLADRLHNMRTIQGHSDVNKQKKIAEETLNLFVPMAEKLALVDVAKELKKISLEVLSKKK
jgi:Na+/proline symporter